MDRTYSRLPIDIDVIPEITSDEVIVLGDLTWPEYWWKNITTYRQYRAQNPDIDEQLARGEIFRAADDTLMYDLLKNRCLDRCDVIAACNSINFQIIRDLHSSGKFRESLFRLSLEDSLLSEEVRAAGVVPEEMKRIIRDFSDRGPNEEANALIAGIEIMGLPEFQGPEGIMRLTRLLYTTPAPFAVESKPGLRKRPDIGVAYAPEEQSVQAGSNRVLLNQLPSPARRDLEHAIYGWVDEMRDAFAEERARTNAYLTSSPDKPSFMSSLTNAQAKALLVPVIDAMNRLPAEHSEDPQVPRALNFIASGLDTVVVVAAADTTYFHPKQRKTVGLSFETLGEYVAIGSSTEDAVNTLCEEAAHSAIRKLYGNHASPFLFSQGGDARDVFLKDILHAELGNDLQRLRFCGGSLSFYDEDEYVHEAVAKVIRQMAQGQWTDYDKAYYPRLTLFVEKVVLRDAEMLERTQAEGKPHIQSRKEIADIMLEATHLQPAGGLPSDFHGLIEGMDLTGIRGMLQEGFDAAATKWQHTPAHGNVTRPLPQQGNDQRGGRS